MEEKPITELQLLLTNSPSSSDVVSAILRYIKPLGRASIEPLSTVPV